MDVEFGKNVETVVLFQALAGFVKVFAKAAKVDGGHVKLFQICGGKVVNQAFAHEII